ncbi:MAG: GNAT family N-acetyltransferase [Candidatus Omnitrophica bacterium]|nr:GNAT family N-acetyltransferase [Candidatus Omnitrophota bacterium]
MSIIRISKTEWICALDDKTVGHFGAILVELKVGPRKINAAWGVDLMVLPEYRKKGLGIALVKEANQHFDAFLAIGGNDMSSSLFIKMGWTYLGKVPYYIRVLDPDTLFKSKGKNLFMPVLVKIYNYLNKPVKPDGVEVGVIDNFKEEADLFWREIERFYKIIIPRNKAYLNRKYDLRPEKHYVRFRAARGKQVCGYLIARITKTESDYTEGLIVDIIVRPNDKNTVRALIFTALKYLKSENCSIVRCCINNKDIEKIIASCGFIKRKPHMRFLIKKNIDGLEELYRLDNWHITSGDSDIDR